ncbi:hypothetical protein BGX26_010032 [Mortierella sp. AD094]|nr:hypothetical protein BGX26_010032 [Mortierella sp. AD094]
MTPPSTLGYYRYGHNSNQPLPMDLMIQIFMHLSSQPQDLLSCALTTRHWSLPALQELYRHPWTYLFYYQFDTEGRVMDKHGSMLLLRTLFQGCMDSSKTAFPYASFARSVNLKWVHDTFDLAEVDIQTLTGFRWTRNEAPKDFLIRHLLANRPYLNDFVHCHAPRLPRCLFAHMTTAVISNFGDDAAEENASTATTLAADGTNTEGSVSGADPANTINTANTASTDSDDWANMMQQVTDDEFLTGLDPRLLATPPLLPVQQPIATAMPFVHLAAAVSSAESSSSSHSSGEHHVTQNSLLQAPHSESAQVVEINLIHAPPSPIMLAPILHQDEPYFEGDVGAALAVVGEISIDGSSETAEVTGVVEEVDDILEAGDEITNILDPTINGVQEIHGQPATQPLSPILASTSAAALLSISSETHLSYDPHQMLVPAFIQSHSRATTSSSLSSPPRPFIASWPLTMEQTQSLVYLDLRHAVVTDSLVVSLSLNCHRIEFLKVATHWQHYPHCYSVTDHALACLVAAQQGLKLVHVENHREVSQGHELVRTIDILASHHGSTLETLVLKLHDFQNCNLAALGKSCQKLTKFAAPGGMHLFREEVTKLTDACKLTLEHLDFSNSDIETDCLTSIMKGTSTPAAARGVLKALVLLGMEDTLNQETCLAIGEYGSGLDCFRLDILESEAKDVSLMLSRPCGLNLRVLTLGCHDVHGDLANSILEQIALNCRNVELLDVNHWQFSAKAIEDVLRECGMLRYLNVSYTDITESTADVICRCLGEVKVELSTPAGPPSDDSLSTPLPFSAFSSSQLRTPAPTHPEEDLALDPTPAQEEWIDEETHARDAETEGEVTGNPDEERPDSMRKRGTELRVKDGEEIDEAYMDTNMDSDHRYVTPVFSANGGGGGVKKQSQLGLVHHYSNAMDLRTIMNLDLDEAIEMDISAGIDEDTGMDLDMCLDLQRYHRNSSYKNGDCDNCDDCDDDDGNVERDEDIEMMSEDEEVIARPREPKGKEVYVGPDYDGSSQDGVSSIFAAIAPAYSSSYGSTSSSSSSSSSSTSGSCSSSTFVTSVIETNQTQSGQVLLLTAEAGVQGSFLCTPLLPPLPIPSRQEDILDTDPVAVVACTSVPLVNGQIQPVASPIPEVAPDQSKVFNDFDSSNSHTTPTHPMATDAEVDETETSLLVDDGETTPSPAPVAKQSSEPETESEESLSLSLAWTKASRLEQVNIECCSLLSLATMTKIKTLSTDRQANFARQGRKKSRIWVENEHDMMMTRLAMERGPELPVTTPRIIEVTTESNSSASVISVSNDSGASGNSDYQLQPASGGEESMEFTDQQEAVHESQLHQESISSLSAPDDGSMTAATTVEVVA